MLFKNFKTERPEDGARVLAFNPKYKRGDPMRFCFVTVTADGMDGVVAYARVEDIEDTCMLDGIFKS